MARTVETERLPRGFAGTVATWRELTPDSGRVLRLPQDGIVEGAVLGLPEGLFDAVVVEALVESMGCLERFLDACAERLAPGGRLVVRAENAQSPRALHWALEGRPGFLDPQGPSCDRIRFVQLRRLLAALEGAGLLVREACRVPSPPQACGKGLAEAMLELGFVAGGYVGGLPPVELWVVSTRDPSLAGSVLVGAGPSELQERTAGAVQRFLPPGWEVLRCEGETERISFDRGVARSRGEALWFLRAGSMPDGELFARLRDAVPFGPAAPGGAGASFGGDLCGVMAPRLDVLATGPLAAEWRNDVIAYEEWALRLELDARAPVGVEGRIVTPPADVDAATIAVERNELLERWRLFSERDSRGGEQARAGLARRPRPWRGPEPRISLCMIARDEESFLGECLRRAAPAVDEIVVVDTGSVDRTREIARSFGAKVIERPWDDDFAAARNASLEAATGDWILALDADEFLSEGAPERIRELCRDAGVCGYHMVLENVHGEARTRGVTIVRLFRRLEGLRWQNRIHEQITPSLLAAAEPSGLALVTCDVRIEHHGYTDEMIERRGKNERNERLFRLHLDEHPEDVYMLYKYGDFLRRLPGRQADALATLERALDLIFSRSVLAPRELPYAGEVAALVALEYSRRGDERRARRLVETALRRLLPTPNLHYVAAGLALSAQDPDEALAQYRRCMTYRDQPLVVPVQDGITTWVALTGMAQAWMQKGDRERARRLLERSRAVEPDAEITVMAWSRLHLEEGRVREAIGVLTDHLSRHPRSVGAAQQAMLLLRRLGLEPHARELGRRAARILEEESREDEASRLRETLERLR